MSEGFIYLARSGGGRMVKIGYSATPIRRLRSLQTGSAEPLVLEFYVPGTRRDEAKYHQMLRHERVRGEWFEGPDTDKLIEVLRSRRRPGRATLIAVTAQLHHSLDAGYCTFAAIVGEMDPADHGPSPFMSVYLAALAIQSLIECGEQLGEDWRDQLAEFIGVIDRSAWEAKSVDGELAYLRDALAWDPLWREK